MQQLLHAKQGQQPALRLRHQHQRQLYWIRRYQGYASLQAQTATAISSADSAQIQTSALLDGIVMAKPALVWQGESALTLPDGSRLQFSQQLGQGISADKLAKYSLSIQWRSGGERFKPFANRPSKTLKKWWQELQVPPWQRQHTPMLYVADGLVMVPGIGVQVEWQASAQEKGWLVTWLPAH
jgi:tRNA(Ile)-lysidine synthase